MDSPRLMNTTRNRMVTRLSNLVLRLATREFQERVQSAILYGLDAHARDQHEDRSRPSFSEPVVIEGRWDRVVWGASRLVLRLASRSYRQMVLGAFYYGVNAQAYDRSKGAPPPLHWTYYVEDGVPNAG